MKSIATLIIMFFSSFSLGATPVWTEINCEDGSGWRECRPSAGRVCKHEGWLSSQRHYYGRFAPGSGCNENSSMANPIAATRDRMGFFINGQKRADLRSNMVVYNGKKYTIGNFVGNFGREICQARAYGDPYEISVFELCEEDL